MHRRRSAGLLRLCASNIACHLGRHRLMCSQVLVLHYSRRFARRRALSRRPQAMPSLTQRRLRRRPALIRRRRSTSSIHHESGGQEHHPVAPGTKDVNEQSRPRRRPSGARLSADYRPDVPASRARKMGVDINRYPSAQSAPAALQIEVAKTIPSVSGGRVRSRRSRRLIPASISPARRSARFRPRRAGRNRTSLRALARPLRPHQALPPNLPSPTRRRRAMLALCCRR